MAVRDYQKFKEAALQDPVVREAYDQLEPEYALIRQIIEIRAKENITQAELAQRAGTQQSHISRLERGSYNPSLQFLKKIAKGINKRLVISFTD